MSPFLLPRGEEDTTGFFGRGKLGESSFLDLTRSLRSEKRSSAGRFEEAEQV